MGLYISDSDVELRVKGKVKIVESEDDDKNAMPRALLRQLISEAESEVEQDLSIRYAIPFQTDDARAFKFLPERPTKNNLRLLCTLMACIRVLETDFGRGSIINGDEYAEKMRMRYNEVRDRLLKIKDGSYNTFIYPPMPSLMLNYQNIADDGFKGMVINNSVLNDGADTPAMQVNDPMESWWYGSIDNEN